MYYTVIKHSGHLRALEKCRKHSPAARVVYISLVFSNACRVLSQCNTRLRLLYLLSNTRLRLLYLLNINAPELRFPAKWVAFIVYQHISLTKINFNTGGAGEMHIHNLHPQRPSSTRKLNSTKLSRSRNFFYLRRKNVGHLHAIRKGELH